MEKSRRAPWRRRLRFGLVGSVLAVAVGVTAPPDAQAQVGPIVSIGTVTVMETLARGDWVPALVPVTLDRVAASPVTVAYRTADGTARADLPDRDYEPAAGTLTIPAGSLGGSVAVFVLGDRRPEHDETVTVALDTATGAAIGTGVGAVVIRDRTGPGMVVSDARVVEPDERAAVRVEATIALPERQDHDVSVDWSTEELAPWPPGGANAGSEFLARSGSALIPAGALAARVQLWVRGDTTPEGPEGFRLVLDPASTTVPVADPAGTITVVDNDPPTPAATTRVSVATDGSPGDGEASGGSMSADGRYVAFSSDAPNLVPGDTNDLTDAFVRDTLTGAVRRVSVASDGTPADDHSYAEAISADGRHVAFVSNATNLVSGDTNGFLGGHDVFVHDAVTGVTTRVSVRSDGSQAFGFFFVAGMSADGRYIAFAGAPSDIVPGSSNDSDVFVHDRATATTTLVSVASDGTPAVGASLGGSRSLSEDGRYVAFSSDATNLVPGDDNGRRDVFVRDRIAGETTLVSVASDGTQSNGENFALSLAVSGDGRYVAFSSDATNLVPGDDNGRDDVFLHDRATASTTLVSIAANGTTANGHSRVPGISADGRFVTFQSSASDLVPGDGNGSSDVFVRDMVAGTTSRVSVPIGTVSSNADSVFGTISSDGRYVTFASDATNLVPHDDNGRRDVFVRGPLR